MRTKCVVFLLCLAFAVPAFSQGIAVRRQVFTATGSSDEIVLRNIPARRHALQWWGEGTLATCSIKVEQSTDGSSWSDLIAAQTCTSNGVFRITTDTSVNRIRITVTALSGGGTITGRYDGYDPIVLNDAGGGEGSGDALVADPLSQFASTTSAQLATVISDETGTGLLAFATSPVFTTPNIGSATGSVSGNAGTATALQNARTIGGTSFDGTANIVPATATAFATTPTKCMAGNYPLGVGVSGNAEDCTPAAAPGEKLLDRQGDTGAIVGDATDKTVFTYTMPGGTMGAGECVKVTAWFLHSTGSAAVDYKLFFGSLSVSSTVTSTLAQYGMIPGPIVCNNTGVTNAQVSGSPVWFIGTAPVQGVNVDAGTEDTTASVVIKLTFNVAATDNVTGKLFVVEHLQ